MGNHRRFFSLGLRMRTKDELDGDKLLRHAQSRGTFIMIRTDEFDLFSTVISEGVQGRTEQPS